MSNSFSIPLAALLANSTAVSSVGNNLANLNTTGYKATTASFRDLVSQQLGTGATSSQLGMGVADPIIKHQFIQGAIQSSSSPLNAAIEGDGFFVVRDAAGSVAYTRDGTFHIDANGMLVNATGQTVQGWVGTAGIINSNGAAGAISIPSGTLQSPLPTANMSLTANLDAGTATNGTFSAPIQIVDSLGKSHVLTVTFTKTGANAWSYDVQIPGEDVQGGTAGKPQSIGNGTLAFDTSGKLTTPAVASGTVALKVPALADGAAAQTINWSLYNPDQTGTLTQYSQTSATSGTQQDGLAAAQPVKIQFSDNGIIVAQYSNGKTVNIAQVALASIRNPDSLLPAGDNDFTAGPSTLAPSVGVAGAGGRGKIVGGALEGSTVDIATEFTNLMVYQRSYQANSKVITTMDELSQDTINIKR